MRGARAVAALWLAAASPAVAENCPSEAGALEQAYNAQNLFRMSRALEETPAERRDALRVVYQVGGAPEDDAQNVCVVVRQGGVEAAWPRADGRRLTPPARALIEGQALVIVRGAGDEAGLEAALEPAVPLGIEMDAAALTRATRQGTSLVKRAHGIVGLAAPGFRGVVFEWDDGPAPVADAVFEDGRRAPLEVVYNRAWFSPGRDRSLARAHRLEFGRAPTRAVLAP